MSEVDAIKRRRRAAARSALESIGEDLLGRAQREAPVEEGTLRGSGAVEVSEDSNSISVEVSFSTVYAARQHEEVTWNHPKGGKAKYLEDPLKAMSQRYLAALAAAIRKAT
jgi:hypothetical protein